MEALKSCTYLLTMVLSVLGPIFLSFEKKVGYVRFWKYAVLASFIVGVPFVLWDIFFTSKGVWGFNSLYVTGIWLIGLPIEEWCFFIVVPFCCLFIYQIIYTEFHTIKYLHYTNIINLILGCFFLVLSWINFDKSYTFFSFGLLGLSLLLSLIIKKDRWYQFWLAYFLQLIPMAIVNGVLTGFPVVWYNNSENLGIRLGSIPVEDFSYGLINFIWVVIVYEKLKEKGNWQEQPKITE